MTVKTLTPLIKHLPMRIGGSKKLSTAEDRLRGRPWQRLRLQILERDKYLCQCEGCQSRKLVTPAHEVDHIVPLFLGGSDDPSNLRAINRDCHKMKTAKESNFGKQE